MSPIISEFARGYIENFNPDITDISVNEDFDVSIMKQGGKISIKSISCGEKVAVAIALRLAIAKALAGRISTIIMDGPTNLDEEMGREPRSEKLQKHTPFPENSTGRTTSLHTMAQSALNLSY